jgi:hypothetical protein
LRDPTSLHSECLKQDCRPPAYVYPQLSSTWGAPAVAFPKPDRPVADIVSPIWHDEKERDEAGESASARHPIRDDRRGHRRRQWLLRRTAVPDRRTTRPHHRTRCRAQIFVGPAQAGARSRIAERIIGLGEPHDPRLPVDSVDVAILVHMYHEIAQPYALLYNLVPALKPGARVGIVDAFRPTSKAWYPAKSAAL